MNTSRHIESFFTNISLNFELCYYTRHPADWHETKVKAHYTIWNIRRGTLCLEINGESHRLSAGASVFFYPGDTYTAYAVDGGCEFLYTIFSIETGNHIDFMKSRDFGGIYHHELLLPKVENLYHAYIEMDAPPFYPTMKLYASFLDLLAELLPLEKNHIVFSHATECKQNHAILTVVEYIHQHFNENPSLDEMLTLCNMSKTPFFHMFKHHIGMSPKQYLTKCRMKHALELLTTSDKQVKEIAYIVGYADPYSFSKAFQKYYGSSPSTFRQNY